MRYRNRTDVSSIGRVISEPAVTNEAGEQIRAPRFREGHFVVSVVEIPAWESWRVTDPGPMPRVFAGRLESSTLYQFPSEAAFINAFEGQPDAP